MTERIVMERCRVTGTPVVVCSCVTCQPQPRPQPPVRAREVRALRPRPAPRAAPVPAPGPRLELRAAWVPLRPAPTFATPGSPPPEDTYARAAARLPLPARYLVVDEELWIPRHTVLVTAHRIDLVAGNRTWCHIGGWTYRYGYVVDAGQAIDLVAQPCPDCGFPPAPGGAR